MRPASWWLLLCAFFLLVFERYELNFLEVAGFALLTGLGLVLLDVVVAGAVRAFREEWNRVREEDEK